MVDKLDEEWVPSLSASNFAAARKPTRRRIALFNPQDKIKLKEEIEIKTESLFAAAFSGLSPSELTVTFGESKYRGNSRVSFTMPFTVAADGDRDDALEKAMFETREAVNQSLAPFVSRATKSKPVVEIYPNESKGICKVTVALPQPAYMLCETAKGKEQRQERLSHR